MREGERVRACWRLTLLEHALPALLEGGSLPFADAKRISSSIVHASRKYLRVYYMLHDAPHLVTPSSTNTLYDRPPSTATHGHPHASVREVLSAPYHSLECCGTPLSSMLLLHSKLELPVTLTIVRKLLDQLRTSAPLSARVGALTRIT